MTKQETAKILAVIKQTYPAFYYRQSEDDIKKLVNLWQSLFEDDDAVIVGAALKSFIVSDASGYPPTPGQIKEKMRLIMHPDRLSEADAWQAVKIAMRNGIYGAEEEYAKLPEEVKRCAVCLISGIGRRWTPKISILWSSQTSSKASVAGRSSWNK
ncbi:MAG: replicative helicase loader/inhibitor [Holdemania massiliensis]